MRPSPLSQQTQKSACRVPAARFGRRRQRLPLLSLVGAGPRPGIVHHFSEWKASELSVFAENLARGSPVGPDLCNISVPIIFTLHCLLLSRNFYTSVA